jgi:hypothetical protein
MVRSECNTAADCRAGERCCLQGYALGDGKPYYPRRCETGPCREAQACRPGSCPEGQRCLVADASDPHELGQCGVSGTITCGEAICRGDRPYCHWDPDARRGRCVTADSSESVYRCDDDGDCLAGDSCWLGVADNSWCCRGAACFDHAATSKYTGCKTDVDCPQLDGMTFSCQHDPELLPSIGRRCVVHYLRK